VRDPFGIKDRRARQARREMTKTPTRRKEEKLLKEIDRRLMSKQGQEGRSIVEEQGFPSGNNARHSRGPEGKEME